jgi:hypothetical protein
MEMNTYLASSRVKMSFVGRLFRLPIQLERHIKRKQTVTAFVPGAGCFKLTTTECRFEC